MPRCQISTHFNGWTCDRCGQPMNPPHLTTIDGQDVAVCAACCPAKHKAEQRVTAKSSCFSTTNEAPGESVGKPQKDGE